MNVNVIDENNIVVDGVEYVAEGSDVSCEGCALDADCWHVDAPCVAVARKDRRHVIWIKKDSRHPVVEQPLVKEPAIEEPTPVTTHEQPSSEEFPSVGDLFYVKSLTDSSYKPTVFRCSASDDAAVVADRVYDEYGCTETTLLMKHLWEFLPVGDSVAKALGLK